MIHSIELLKHRRNHYSHNGEDGVLATLLSKLPERNFWAVEFGAWDGKQAANTAHLLESGDWNVIFIECDDKKFAELQLNHGKNPKAHLLKKFIDFSGSNALTALLQSVPECPQDLDFISMDVDGCEYHIWESLTHFRPKIVLVEFNPSIPIDYHYVQSKDFSIHEAASLGAFVELGQRLGYTLVSVLDYNALFVRTEYLPQMGYVADSPETLFQPFRDRYQTRIWQSMDGRLHLLGCNRLIWHNIEIREAKIQILPRLLQINTAGNSRLKQILKFIYNRVPFAPEITNLIFGGKFNVPKPQAESSPES